MKKHFFISIACVFAVFTAFFSTNAYAFSIFNINTDSFSYSKFLPVVVGGTFLIEAVIIMLVTKIRRIVNVSFSVLIANIASFLVIRILLGVLMHKFFYSEMLINGTSMIDWLIFGLCFVITLAIELPIIWFSLKPFTPKKKILVLSAVSANIVSFIAIAVFELYLVK